MTAILAHDVWVAVCDGRKALLFQNTGDTVAPKLELRRMSEHENPKTSDLGTSPPGRTVQSHGSGKSAVSETDYHDENERKFLVKFAQNLDWQIGDKHIRKLVLVAPPRALGMIRPVLSVATKRILQREIHHDYTKQTAAEIEQHLLKLE